MEGPSSILRNSPLPSPRPHRVHFKPPSNLNAILLRCANSRESFDEVQGFMTHARNLEGPALLSWIQELQENIALLNEHMEGFVQSLFKISWANQGPQVMQAFTNFLLNLLSAHGVYLKDILHSLVANFLLPEEGVHDQCHEVLQRVLSVCPLHGKRSLVKALQVGLPYALTNAFDSHKSYCRNLLRIINYVPDMSKEILEILIQRAVELDVRMPKDALEEEEEELEGGEQFDFDDSVSTKSTTATNDGYLSSLQKTRINMEALMGLFFQFIDDNSEGNDGKRIYKDFASIFEIIILPTWATEHVQFTLFYLVSKDPSYAHDFLLRLWKNFINPNASSIVRQTSVSYIASLIARGKFISLSVAKSYLEKVTGWIHAYIKNSDYVHKDFMFSDIKAHGAFYSSVQCVFYMFAFRHEELVEGGKKNMEFLKSLHFNTIVTSPLNPLRVILPPVVKNFASISRNLQLAYCEPIIQRNKRINLPIVGSLSEIKSEAKPLLLDSFFPFDPYVLKDTLSFVEPIYRTYSGGGEDSDDSEEEEAENNEEEEEERMEIGSYRGIPSFGYGTSPGFKMI
eukprot:TRINITY_DN4056_c0_g1_i2.p1 TRINITY_DN4056_c0_g1~~TRINITY_DN4056_c0_g1_i2.p1  ORF type:complete len:570 (-),score=154.47 TRINITY_DN4056_c0_g1_i2:1864-3573(-)